MSASAQPQLSFEDQQPQQPLAPSTSAALAPLAVAEQSSRRRTRSRDEEDSEAGPTSTTSPPRDTHPDSALSPARKRLRTTLEPISALDTSVIMPQVIDDPVLPPPVHSPISIAAHGLLSTNGHGSNSFGGAAAGTATAGNGAVLRTDAMDYEEGDTASVVLRKPLWEGSQIDRREFVRLALQAFKDMGYK